MSYPFYSEVSKRLRVVICLFKILYVSIRVGNRIWKFLMCVPCSGPWDMFIDSPEDKDRRQYNGFGSTCEKCPPCRSHLTI